MDSPFFPPSVREYVLSASFPFYRLFPDSATHRLLLRIGDVTAKSVDSVVPFPFLDFPAVTPAFPLLQSTFFFSYRPQAVFPSLTLRVGSVCLREISQLGPPFPPPRPVDWKLDFLFSLLPTCSPYLSLFFVESSSSFGRESPPFFYPLWPF